MGTRVIIALVLLHLIATVYSTQRCVIHNSKTEPKINGIYQLYDHDRFTKRFKPEWLEIYGQVYPYKTVKHFENEYHSFFLHQIQKWNDSEIMWLIQRVRSKYLLSSMPVGIWYIAWTSTVKEVPIRWGKVHTSDAVSQLPQFFVKLIHSASFHAQLSTDDAAVVTPIATKRERENDTLSMKIRRKQEHAQNSLPEVKHQVLNTRHTDMSNSIRVANQSEQHELLSERSKEKLIDTPPPSRNYKDYIGYFIGIAIFTLIILTVLTVLIIFSH